MFLLSAACFYNFVNFYFQILLLYTYLKRSLNPLSLSCLSSSLKLKKKIAAHCESSSIRKCLWLSRYEFSLNLVWVEESFSLLSQGDQTQYMHFMPGLFIILQYLRTQRKSQQCRLGRLQSPWLIR